MNLQISAVGTVQKPTLFHHSDQNWPILIRSSSWGRRTWMLLPALRANQIPLVHCQHSGETPCEVREALPAHSDTFKFSQ